jgi:peroxiredoxin Q/BCP
MNEQHHPYLKALLAGLKNGSCLATMDSNLLLAKLTDKNIVIYFYPRDNTPGCTAEGESFTEYYKDFQKCNTEIIGISRDSVASHISFKLKYNFPFELSSDFNSVMCNAFEGLKSKTVSGKTITTLERATFLFNKRGFLVNDWKQVKVPGHAKDVLSMAKGLS